MKKSLFLLAAMSIAVGVWAAPDRTSKWVLSTAVYEKTNALFATEFVGKVQSDNLALASNKVFVGGSDGLADQVTPSGLFTITTAGVSTNSRQGVGWTNGTLTVTVQTAPVAVSGTELWDTAAGAAISSIPTNVTVTLTPETANFVKP